MSSRRTSGLPWRSTRATGAGAVHDRDLRYLFVSDRYLSDYKVSEQNIIGKHHYEVFPEIPETWRAVHRRALQGEVLESEDDFYVNAEGKTV